MRTTTLVLTLALGAFTLAAQEPAPLVYAIAGARIVPVSGPPIASGTIVLRDGLIADVGANVTPPAGAIRIEGKGLTVYPGLIDMGSTAGLEPPTPPGAVNPQTREDIERAKRLLLLRADLRAADHMTPTAEPLARAAAAGITSVLAAPRGDAIRGYSALVNTALPPDAPQIGAAADERRGQLVIRSPVALHVSFAARPGGGNAYPNSLMGVIAFVRQAFVNARHHRVAAEHAARVTTGATRPAHDAALEAMAPAVAGQVPVAFEASAAREILRALDMAREFELTPVITNAREADEVTADLSAAKARVILSLNYPTRPVSLAPDADEPLRALRSRANAPKVPAALEKAGLVFAFESDGLSDPADFVRHAARAVENGTSRDRALRALTLDAAAIAGAADRLGSLETGKIANILVTEGELFDEKMTIRDVFVDGRPVNLEAAPRREGQRRGTQ